MNFLNSSGIGTNSLKSSNIKDAMGVGGEIHSILGVVKLPLVIGNTVLKQSFHVFEKLQQQMSLGMDFLEPNKIDISLANKTIYIPDPETNIINSVELNSGIARTLVSTRIPPFHQAEIHVVIYNVQISHFT